MHLYERKLEEMVPVLVRHFEKKQDGVIVQYVTSVNSISNEHMDTYLDAVEDFCDSFEGITGKRIFIITDKNNIGIKAAGTILNHSLYSNVQETLEYNSKRSEAFDGAELKCEVNQLSKMRIVEARDYSALFRGPMPKNEVYYFVGLDENDMSDLLFEYKLKCIKSCPSEYQFVQLCKEQVNTAWARELMMDKECEVIYLPNVELRYYVGIMRELLSGERYKLEDGLEVELLVRNMMKKNEQNFGEEVLAWSLDMAVKNAKRRGEYRVLKVEDFSFDVCEQVSPLKSLEQMSGLKTVKNAAWEMAAFVKEQQNNPALSDICWHMIFKGNPGTGKTMCGKIIAQIKEESGQSNGIFIQAARKDIIGEHVGQTAPLVAGLFAKARKGVLFVDEAGFLLHESRASYNQEAIKEFVRYMELYQDVTVIFALYPHEVEEWLKLDVGLSSRISRIVTFEDYTEEELLEIAEGMCKNKGYQLETKAREMITTYSKQRKKMLGDEFGNAREMRKLVEAAIIAKSMRCYDVEEKEDVLELKAVDFENGIKRLAQEKERKVGQIGFQILQERRLRDGADEQAC